MKTLQKMVDRFNTEYPVGTKVILRKDSGEVETEVRAPAEVVQGHSAVGWFVGVSGFYLIEDNRIRALATVRKMTQNITFSHLFLVMLCYSIFITFLIKNMRRKNILQIPLNDLELEMVKSKAESLQLKTTELVRRILEKALKSGRV